MSERYRVKADGDGHYYLIPAGEEEAWEAWLVSADFAVGLEPPWAQRIDGVHRLTFSDPKEE